MTKPIRTTGTKCRRHVQAREAFTNSNGQLVGRYETPLLYVVYSYGTHWPLFVWDGFDWYENEERASATTSKHRSQTHPHTPTQLRTCRWLKDFIRTHTGHHRALTDVQTTLGLAA